MPAKKSPPPTDALLSAGGKALAVDEALRDQTRKVFSDALLRATYILNHGSETDRNSLIKAIVPQMMRSLQDEQADQARQAQRDAYERMKDAMRGGKSK